MSNVSGWEPKRLTDLATYINGFAFKPEDWGQEGLPIIRIEQLKNPEAPADYFSGKLPPTRIIKDGDLIFSWSASLFLRVWQHGLAALNQHLFKVIEFEGIDRIFLKSFIEFHLPELTAASHGSTMQHITRKELGRFVAPFPESEHEQAKIAEILSTVDRAIEQTEALIAKQERIKTGLMQDLLTRGIDEHGNIRSESTHEFKDSPLGRIPTDWDCVAIGEIARVRSGTTPLRSNPAFWSDGTIPWVKTGEIKFSAIECAEEMVTAHALKNTSLHLEPVGTVLIAMYGQGGTRGQCGYLEIEATTNQACAAIFGSNERVNQKYLYQYLVSQYSDLRMIGHGSNQVNLSGRILADFAIKLPPISEQNRLSECFTQVDIQTNECRLQHYKLRSLKTALMQDLLTGKKRVTPLLG